MTETKGVLPGRIAGHFLRVVFILFLLLAVCYPATAKAYEYDLNSYDVNIRVSKDNVLHITETIGAYFNVSKHGIYRKIPLVNQVKRLDGSEDTIRADVDNISTNATKSVSYSGGYCTIRLGDEDRTLTGDVEYVISYDYALDGDNLPDKDEFYFNLIGTEWEDTEIDNVTFTIEMPEAFDEEKLGFSKGYAGSTSTEDILYYVDGNTISGMLTSKLTPCEALTIRLELPEGYFTVRKKTINWLDYLGVIVPVLCLLIAGLLWYKVGRDDPVVDTVEFTAPENRNSAEAAFALNGSVDSEDVISLLVYLANKGYIEISQVQKKAVFGTKEEFQLRKLKEYDGYNEEERIFMNGLFKSGDIVDKSDLENKFYTTVNTIVSRMNSKENKEYIFEKNSINKSWLLMLMVIGCYLLISLPPLLYESGGHLSPDIVFPLVFPSVAVIVLFAGLFSKGNAYVKVFLGIWAALFGGMPFCLLVLPALKQKNIFMRNFIVGMICIIGIFFFKAIMSKRTKYGNEILGRVRGFKNFIEVAEKDRLEALVEKNPNYFYDILPYAYAFGISKKWMEKFESIAMAPPTWYGGTDFHAFNMHQFQGFMDSTMRSASSSMTSSPSSSGGGSSGGGSGGGGGGSW